MSEFDLWRALRELEWRLHIAETTQPLGFSAVSQGQTRFVGNESLLVQGSEKVEGWLVVTGTQRVTGRLEGSGTFDWTGPWFLRGNGTIPGDVSIVGVLKVNGAWELNGSGKIVGNVDITGALDVRNRLTVGAGGYIEAGTVRIDRGGSYGGRVASTGAVLALSAGTSVVVDADNLIASKASLGATSILGNLTVTGNQSVSGTKNFRIPHPLKQDHYLLHASTESPVSGVEYWGDEVLPESGELLVQLPDYFEALTAQTGRSVFVTGRGFVADWGDVTAGAFTVTGTPGGRFSWLVKAARSASHGGDFPQEETVYGPLRKVVGPEPAPVQEEGGT